MIIIGTALEIKVVELKKRIGIVIPCFNESENIPKLLERCKIAVLRADCEFLLVDNGSTDTTWELFNSFGHIPGIKFLKLEKNQGYGGGILAGLKELDNQFIGWTHADLQTDPVDIQNIEINQANEQQFLKGSRRHRKINDQVFTLGMSLLMTILFSTRLSDINAQPTIMSKRLFESWESPPADFSIDLYAYVVAKRNSAIISRFPVDFSTRLAGISKWNNGMLSRFRMIWRTIKFAIKLKRELKR
jgi:glycosyltransferase involved in cell wall biosynthesis